MKKLKIVGTMATVFLSCTALSAGGICIVKLYLRDNRAGFILSLYLQVLLVLVILAREYCREHLIAAQKGYIQCLQERLIASQKGYVQCLQEQRDWLWAAINKGGTLQ